MKSKEEYVRDNLDDLFRFWTIRAAFWGGMLFLVWSSLDYFMYKEYFVTFLSYRLFIAVILFIISLFLRKAKNIFFQKILMLIAVLLSCLAIELLILKTGGHTSLYFVGFIAAAIIAHGFVPGSMSYHSVITITICSVYIGPIVIYDDITKLATFIGSNTLIIIIIVMLLYLRFVQNKKLEHQFSLQYDLEQLKNNLQEEVNKRTDQLFRAMEKLRNLTVHMQTITEQERAHIAREIHDELGQELTALKMDTISLKKRIPEDQVILHEKTDSMKETIDTTINTVKRISSELRPRMLDDLGLQAAMEWHAKDFQERTGIVCDVFVDLNGSHPDKEHATNIFRIFQESLTNVARHANATEVNVSLKENGDSLVMTVSDNGRGIEDAQIKDSGSFGLIGMRERVRYLGGTIEINGVRNQGTEIKVIVPRD